MMYRAGLSYTARELPATEAALRATALKTIAQWRTLYLLSLPRGARPVRSLRDRTLPGPTAEQPAGSRDSNSDCSARRSGISSHQLRCGEDAARSEERR